MTALLIGYARVSTDAQDLTVQREGLLALGVDPARLYVDHGLTGTNRERPGLREALAACREGDTLVVTKLDRLARSLPDARAIAEELTVRQVRLSLGGSVYDPHDPVGRLLFNVLAMVAEFESDLIRLRTREGMRVAKAKGKLRGKQPKLNSRQEAHLLYLYRGGEHSTAELADCSASPAPPSTGHCNATRRTVTEQRRTARVFAAELHRRRPQGCPAGHTLRDIPITTAWPPRDAAGGSSCETARQVTAAAQRT
jgi:DNA invertase Pin-like site-specific DNA recombinase